MKLSIVSSHFKEDVSWLYNSEFPVFIVSKNPEINISENKLVKVHYIKNRCSEFGSYFWFICNYWDSLPDKIAFVHGHEKSHHQSMLIFDAIEQFKDFSFHGLNGPRTISYHYFCEDVLHPWFPNCLNIWNSLGLNKICYMPRQFVFEGGTQTIISKDLIKSNPFSFYKNILDFVMSQSQNDSYSISIFLEVVWHVLFHQNPINFEIFDFDLNQFFINNKISIALMGPECVWHSRMNSSIRFNNQELSQSEWKKMCFNFLNIK